MVQHQECRIVDPKIWQECIGNSLTVPKLHSKVYYFPLGHFEHACPNTTNTQTLSLLNHGRPFILCTVSSVDLLADLDADQVFAKLLLTPVIEGSIIPVEASNEDDGDGDHVVSHAKILTPSDANNGGAFSVPRASTNSVFPPLDLTTPSPTQEISVTDVCGVVWTFSLVYRGYPKRYQLTTGWSAFVDKKQLVAGDTIVFIKNSAGEIFVGIRRRNMFGAATEKTEKTFINAVELAEKNTPFEVVCYPMVGGFDFVVGDKVVEDAMKVNWNCGMRVTHTVKTSKGGSTFHGTISTINSPSTRPWRMLQVEWDESEVSENLKRVSPWQVELSFSIPLLRQPLPPSKRLRAAQGFAVLSDPERVSSISMTNFNNFSMEPLNQTLLVSDGMLGVRQNHFFASTSSNSLKDSSFENSSMEEADNVSIDLNTTSHISDNHSLLNSSGTKLTGHHNCNTGKVRPRSIKLFGQIIHPAESCLDDSAIKRADGCEMCNEVEDAAKSVAEK